MPAGTVLDYSGWRPTDADYRQAHAWGIVGFVRYPDLGAGTAWKACTKSEYDRILNFGFQIAFTPELNATTWRGGKPVGREIGAKARNWVHGLGFPDSRCLHFAIDSNVAPGELNLALDFLHGCNEGGGVGIQSCYGETSVIDAGVSQGVICNGWRSAATSWDPTPSVHASMLQTTQHSYAFAGAYDENIILKPDWGQHPAPTGDDDMALPFTLWQTGDGKCWRVDAGGQSRVLVPDGLNHVAFNFNLMKEGGELNPRIRPVDTPEAQAYIASIPVSGAVILPPLPPYPTVPSASDIARAVVVEHGTRLTNG
jgi:hypothetical protein